MAGPAETLDVRSAVSWIEAFATLFEQHREELNDLDRRSGDGDFGTNLRSALEHVASSLAAGGLHSVGHVFAAVSEGFMQAGGTSGPLFGMWFREFSNGAVGRTALDLEGIAAAATSGVAVVQRLGGAQVGDKTMVDAMVPAAEALTRAVAESVGLAPALASAAAAARQAAESTAELIARRGRASYVGDAARGVVDPGALTVALFFDAAPSA